ncbi:MAG: PDZ domain-containing protein [Terriglobales bacterium]
MKPTFTLSLVLAVCLAAAAQKPLPPAPPAPPAPAAAAMLPSTPLAPVVFAQDMVYFGGNSWLGVSLADLTADSAKQLHLSSADGAEVKEVFPDSPAARAGIKSGDVVVRFHGDPVISVRELTRMVSDEPPDRTVQVGLIRAGQPVTVEVRIGRRRHANDWPDVEMHIPPMPKIHVAIPNMALTTRMAPFTENSFYFRALSPEGASLGIAVEEIPSQLAHYFGVNADRAVLVRSVAGSGIGDTAGLRAGDVILSVAGAKVTTVDQFYNALREHRSSKFALQVLRKGQPASVEIPALEPRMQGSADESWPSEAATADAMANVQVDLARQMKEYQREIDAARPQIEAAARLEASGLRQQLQKDMAAARKQIEAARKALLDAQRKTCCTVL